MTPPAEQPGETPVLDETQPHLELHVSANAGSFGLDIGGTCDA